MLLFIILIFFFSIKREIRIKRNCALGDEIHIICREEILATAHHTIQLFTVWISLLKSRMFKMLEISVGMSIAKLNANKLSVYPNGLPYKK